MIVGALQIDLRLSDCHSLKEKRSVLRRLTARLRQAHNIAIAEVDHQDAWQSARLGVTAVSSRTLLVEKVLHRVLNEIDGQDGVEVVGHLLEIL
jgi:hypothetical protein